MMVTFKAVLRSFGYAGQGLKHCFATQRNFRIEVYLGMMALVLSLWLGVGFVEVVLCCMLVLSLEAVNTALEAVVDLVSPEYHPLAKIAKDACAGAVLVAALGSLVLGCYMFIPKLLSGIP